MVQRPQRRKASMHASAPPPPPPPDIALFTTVAVACLFISSPTKFPDFVSALRGDIPPVATEEGVSGFIPPFPDRSSDNWPGETLGFAFAIASTLPKITAC